MVELSFGKKFVLQYSSLVEQISEFLTNAIVQGQLQNGQRLVEGELQRQFGVSRAPIREALRILETNGFLTTEPRKGTSVRMDPNKLVEENLPIRAILEGYAARLATLNLQVHDIDRMELALAKMTEVVNNRDFKSYIKYHIEFHELFIHASKNETLIRILGNLRRHSTWFTNIEMGVFVVEESSEYLLKVHREILKFLIQKDGLRAENQVKEHILHAAERFQALIKKKQKNGGN